jgi:hypothetical protein
MDSLGYDINYTAIDYTNGNPAALGNYIANRIIAYGYTDGSNEINNYAYQYYQPVNPKILVEQPGNPSMIDPNRWQAISLSVTIDQAGNLLTSDPPHLGPEWGNVKPFSMTNNDVTMHTRDGNVYKVYHDQGDPAYMDTINGGGLEDLRDGILTLPAALAIRDPEIAELFSKEDPSTADLQSLSVAFQQQLPHAESYLDHVVVEAKKEAEIFANDPQPLFALIEETRKLSGG